MSGARVTRSSTGNTSARNATSGPVTHNDIGTPHLKIFYTNACSLFNKLGEIKCIVDSSEIICITETHFSTEYFDAELAIPNYRIFRNDRDAQGGGLC